nr:tyrosine-type recombinase/integrase [Enterococcus malodoratus]
MDQQGISVTPVQKYLKYLDSTQKSPNTLKTYCYALKHFFTFLSENDLDYKKVKLEDLVDFMSWLRTPYNSTKIIPLQAYSPPRKEKTINLTLSVISSFYDYQYRNENLSNTQVENLFKKTMGNNSRSYKGLLHHVSKRNEVNRNVLKVKEPKIKIRALNKNEVNIILNAATNIRDKLLIQILFETGMRIGEVLSLHIEDFIFDHQLSHYINIVYRGQLENGARLKSGERKILISQELMELYDDYLYDVIDEIGSKSNHLFIKLAGQNKGDPMEYWNVSSVFKRLKEKTNLHLYPHLLRHTHATLFYQKTKDIKQLQDRLGHAQIQTTMDSYLHPTDEEIRASWLTAQPEFNFDNTILQEDCNDPK